ncbi:hypothetical protein [Fimbriimonas ginsengisoli]|uniref:hypothetical protein n=1 Tax=Fimbriimonas ginsengisoli TaxID=1005039 RepID=UPI0011849A20|nr:hypothetical protein [Fimbriimonas ginsengisoli]
MQWLYRAHIGVAFHTVETDIWLIEPLANLAPDEDAPLFVLDKAPVPITRGRFLSVGGRRAQSYSSPSLAVDISPQPPPGRLSLELADGHMQGNAQFALGDCLAP